MSIEELEVAAMQLPPEERERLGEMLLASVDVPESHEEAWAAEIDRRVHEIRNGTARLVSSDAMFRDALERLS